jgi:hypothetical protein
MRDSLITIDSWGHMEFKDGLTAAVALAVVWLGHRFTINRSVADQLWEMRRSTYSFVLAKMSEMDGLVQSMQGWLDQYGWPQDAERFDQLEADLWATAREIQARLVADYLTVSPEARKLIEAFRDLGPIDEDDDPVTRNLEAHEALKRNLAKFRPQLQLLAIDELEDLRRGIVERFWHRLKTGQRPASRDS